MSYILDALKKSEQERQRGTTPTLRTAPTLPSGASPARRWVYPTLAVALAAAAFAAGWLQPWRAEPPAAAHLPTTPPATQAPVQVADTPTVEPLPAPPAPAAPAVLSAATAPSHAAPPSREPVEPAPAKPAPPARDTAPALPSRETAVADARRAQGAAPATQEEPSARETIPTVAELPPALRAELPSMTITVHAYSPTPRERLLGVNAKLLREGDTLTPDLVLETITPDGMIFSYKGTRFRRGLR